MPPGCSYLQRIEEAWERGAFVPESITMGRFGRIWEAIVKFDRDVEAWSKHEAGLALRGWGRRQDGGPMATVCTLDHEPPGCWHSAAETLGWSFDHPPEWNIEARDRLWVLAGGLLMGFSTTLVGSGDRTHGSHLRQRALVGATYGRLGASELTRYGLEQRTKKLLRLFGRMVLRVAVEDGEGIKTLVPKCLSLVIRDVSSDWLSSSKSSVTCRGALERPAPQEQRPLDRGPR
jgi:hypothetical protein